MAEKNILEDNTIFDAIASGIPVKDTLPDGVDELIENFYGLASSLYDDEEYEKAARLFGVLCLLDYREPKYSIGVGACMQCLKRYEQAIFCYMHTTMTDINDPKAAFYGGECSLAIGDIKSAMEFYSYASTAKNEDEQSKIYREKATSLLEQLKKDYFSDSQQK